MTAGKNASHRKKRWPRIFIGLAFVVMVVIASLGIMARISRKPTNLGVVDGHLSACPDTPNCVSTQADDTEHRMEPIRFSGSADEARGRLERVLEGTRRANIVTLEDNYPHVEFRSALFRFVDNVEFLIDEDEQVIHFRSASRVGYSDFGKNRRRMENIRKEFNG